MDMQKQYAEMYDDFVRYKTENGIMPVDFRPVEPRDYHGDPKVFQRLESEFDGLVRAVMEARRYDIQAKEQQHFS